MYNSEFDTVQLDEKAVTNLERSRLSVGDDTAGIPGSGHGPVRERPVRPVMERR